MPNVKRKKPVGVMSELLKCLDCGFLNEPEKRKCGGCGVRFVFVKVRP
jgi:hypothetical protein